MPETPVPWHATILLAVMAIHFRVKKIEAVSVVGSKLIPEPFSKLNIDPGRNKSSGGQYPSQCRSRQTPFLQLRNYIQHAEQNLR